MKLRHVIYPAEQWGGETEFDPGFWLREAWFWVARRPWYWLRERYWPTPAQPDEGPPGLHGLREDLSDLIYLIPPGGGAEERS
jgi:hypothetical protein